MLHLINRLFKLSIFITLLALISYTGLWFYSTYKIKQLINEHSTESENSLKLSYDEINITGFPFKIKTEIDNLSINFMSENPKIESVSTYEKVILETNILFKDLKISAFGNSTSNALFADKVTILDSIYKDGCYINIASNTINTRKIIKALSDEKELDDIKLSQISFTANNVVNFDRETKTEISTVSTNIQISFDRPSDILTNTFVKIDAQADIFPEGKELFSNLTNLPPLSKLSVKADLEYSSKLEEESSSNPLVDLKFLEVSLDETVLTAKARVQNDNKGETVFNVNFNAIKWNTFLQVLVSKNIISKERYDAIVELASEIKGEKFSQDTIDLKLSNENGLITLDGKPLHTLIESFTKLKKSE